MIKSFSHNGIQVFFETGSKAGIQSRHAERPTLQLAALEHATKPEDLNVPKWRLHPLKSNLKNHWSMTVSDNWRLTFKFDGHDFILLDYQDYH